MGTESREIDAMFAASAPTQELRHCGNAAPPDLACVFREEGVV
jgi:hypothetical protein